ncbi:MAG: 30S ribosomal protein S20 [Verrucomicrobiota bacterium]
MANSKSAEKRSRVSQRRREINRRKVSKARTLAKSVHGLVDEGKKEEAAKSLASVQSAVDKAVKCGAMSPNKAARTKSQIAKSLKS